MNLQLALDPNVVSVYFSALNSTRAGCRSVFLCFTVIRFSGIMNRLLLGGKVTNCNDLYTNKLCNILLKACEIFLSREPSKNVV